MKKMFITVLFLLTAVLVFTPKLYAVEINAGAMLWYTTWSPHWEDEFRDVFADEASEKSDFNMDNAYLYGPVFSMKITDRLRVAANFLYGKYGASCFKMWYEGGTETRVIQSEMDVTKLDADLVLSYSFLKYFQLFLGGKYQRYTLKETQRGIYQIAGAPIDRDLASNSYGPGLGVGLTLPLAENFALLFNVSGIFLFARVEDQWSEESGANPPAYTYDLNAYGGNTTVSLAYFVSSADITLITGFRYQYLRYEQKSVSRKNYDPGDEFRFPRDYDGKTDTFLGISIAVLYSFVL